MHYEFHQKILFKHCDPAGIVFFPRYFEMLNDTVERFFEDCLRWPFKELHENAAVPTASLDTDFKAPSKLGDCLTIQLTIQKLGRTSMTLRSIALRDTELRFRSEQVIVFTDKDGRPQAWPDKRRVDIMKILEG